MFCVAGLGGPRMATHSRRLGTLGSHRSWQEHAGTGGALSGGATRATNLTNGDAQAAHCTLVQCRRGAAGQGPGTWTPSMDSRPCPSVNVHHVRAQHEASLQWNSGPRCSVKPHNKPTLECGDVSPADLTQRGGVRSGSLLTPVSGERAFERRHWPTVAGVWRASVAILWVTPRLLSDATWSALRKPRMLPHNLFFPLLALPHERPGLAERRTKRARLSQKRTIAGS